MVAVMLFHRDLRMEDNTALLACTGDGHIVVPLFVFPPEQIERNHNPYFSNASVQFMCESLQDLSSELHKKQGSKLLMVKGNTLDVLDHLYKQLPFTHLYMNKDLSVYALERDAKVATWCAKRGVSVSVHEDYGLLNSSEGLLPDGRPYTVLAQYYRRFLKDLHVRKVDSTRLQRAHFLPRAKFPSLAGEIEAADLRELYEHNVNIKVQGGRRAGLALLSKLGKHHAYATERDIPALEGTTRASAHLRFGTFSVREMYWELRRLFGSDHPLIRELVFRDFYMKIYTHRPSLQRGEAYRKDMDKTLPWRSPSRAKREWRAWTTGTTGFPLVDAGMRQLLHEGWMHNRVRMLVASVATRYLYLDWRACARFFYQHLVDADPFSNTAGWQWAAGIGVDSAPYFRAPFNPFLQSKRFDREADYIKRWVPELRDVKPEHIHRWGEDAIRAMYSHIDYQHPIVEQKERSRESLKIWKEAATSKRV